MLKYVCGVISGILICAILYALKFVNVRIDESGRDLRRAKSDINSLNTAIEIYYKKLGKLPGNEDGLDSLSPAYVDMMMPDPWGNEYFYAAFNTHNKSCFVVWSYGADKKPGGINEAEDIFVFSKNGNCI